MLTCNSSLKTQIEPLRAFGPQLAQYLLLLECPYYLRDVVLRDKQLEIIAICSLTRPGHSPARSNNVLDRAGRRGTKPVHQTIFSTCRCPSDTRHVLRDSSWRSVIMAQQAGLAPMRICIFSPEEELCESLALG